MVNDGWQPSCELQVPVIDPTGILVPQIEWHTYQQELVSGKSTWKWKKLAFVAGLPIETDGF